MTTADVLAAAPPDLTTTEAEEVARTLFDIGGTARALVSERDQNFLLTDATGGEQVLKVSNAAEDRGVAKL